MGFSLARAYSYKQIVYIHNNSITIYIILLTSYNIRRRRQQKHFGFRFSFLKMVKRLEKNKARPCKNKAGRNSKLKSQFGLCYVTFAGKTKTKQDERKLRKHCCAHPKWRIGENPCRKVLGGKSPTSCADGGQARCAAAFGGKCRKHPHDEPQPHCTRRQQTSDD